MKRSINYVLSCIAITGFLFACQTSLSDQMIADIQDEILEVTDWTLERFYEKDTANCYKHYSDDFKLLSEGLFKMKAGDLPEFVAGAKKTIMERDDVKYDILESEVEVFAENVANHYYTYTRSVIVDEEVLFAEDIACTMTFVKEGDLWMIRSATISYPLEHFRAGENDKVLVIENTVYTDKKSDFEKFMHEIFFDKAPEVASRNQQLFKRTRILHPAKDNDDGTSTYFFIMDPVIENANYQILLMMNKIYGEEKAKELYQIYQECHAAPQKSYFMVQSRH